MVFQTSCVELGCPGESLVIRVEDLFEMNLRIGLVTLVLIQSAGRPCREAVFP